MEPDDGHALDGEEGELDARMCRIVRVEWRRCRGRLPSDLFEDCLVEAHLLHWRIRERLIELPEEERPAFAAACIRRRLRQYLRGEAGASQELLDQLAAAAREALDAKGRAEWQAFLDDDGPVDVQELLARLRPRERLVLRLRFWERLTHAEIAGRLGVSEAAAKKQVERAVARLRKLFEG
jgi:RNA polymerase sigma factor (sigma-70 family)